jgi:Fe-S-cluster containining protein
VGGLGRIENFALQLKNERALYRELFLNAEKTFKELIKGMKADFSCLGCGECGKAPNTDFPSDPAATLPQNCAFRGWQELIVHLIKTETAPVILGKTKEIREYRHSFQCKRTGTCCRLASSEFSYAELLEKAKNNDNYASQFTQVFVPYEKIEDARAVFPQYVDLLLAKFGEDGGLNFFHCKYLKGDNVCPIYEDRPQICRDFPDNPLAIIPPTCGYYAWKEEVAVAAYTFHAMSQIYGFYLEKIENALGSK